MAESQEIQRLQAALESSESTHAGAQGSFSSRLSFDSGLERDYLDFRLATSLPLIRAAMALAVLAYLGFLVSDALVFRLFQHDWIYAIILTGCVPINTVLIAATFVPRFTPWVPTLAWVAALLNALSLSLIIAEGVQQGVKIPHEVLTLQLLFDFFLLGLAWRIATPIVLVSVLFFLATNHLAGMPGHELFQQGYFYVVAAVLGSIGCYMSERAQRLAWVRARLLKELSEHDAMTGLYNRRVFFHRGDVLLRQARRDRRELAVLLVDVDHFKRFNDTHGHLAGDECLRQVAKALQAVARRPLDVAARIGGEEFCVLLYDTHRSLARQQAETLREVVRSLVLEQGARVTVSIGIAHHSPETFDSLQALVGRADEALYRAKEAGRDRVAEAGSAAGAASSFRA